MNEDHHSPALPDIAQSNARHDSEHGDPYQFEQSRIRCGWNEAAMMRRKPLTDRQIARYDRKGFYSQELKDARKERAKKKRQGNFELVDGRMIYRL